MSVLHTSPRSSPAQDGVAGPGTAVGRAHAVRGLTPLDGQVQTLDPPRIATPEHNDCGNAGSPARTPNRLPMR